MKRFIVHTILFAVFLVVAFEVIFRTIIPACELPVISRDDEFMVLKYDTAAVRDGLFTSGRLTQQRSHWHVNNHGWISDIDYLPKDQREKPLIAVLGDSYIEGFFVEWSDHLANQIAEGLDNEYDVYAFGVSGAVMSQYIAVSEYVEQKFQPDVVICFINQGDIVTSLERYANRSRNMQLRYHDHNFFEIPPGVYSRSRIKTLLLKSAIVRYFFMNANLNLLKTGVVDAETKDSGLTETEALEKEHIINEAAAYIVNRMKDVYGPDTRLMFVVDGDREALYANPDQIPEKLDTSVPLQRACEIHGCDFFDMSETFYENYQRSHHLFNFKHNYHWNEYANEVIADTLIPIFVEVENLPGVSDSGLPAVPDLVETSE